MKRLVVAAALLLAFPAVTALPRRDGADASCERVDLTVSLIEGEAPTHAVAAWLCAPRHPRAQQTVLLASPTGLSDHRYWDWPADPALSFVRAATGAGFAVLTYDRIGTGESERPAAALVTVESEAFVQHQLVQALRAGDIGGVRFGHVVLLGNSLSTLISIYQQETYRDADGLVNTGIFVGPLPHRLAQMFSFFYPAQFDPKFAGRDDIPLGYATTQPGTRDAFFYAPGTSPETIALDEAWKETATVGEATTFGSGLPLTRLVDVPVLSILGDHDLLFCQDVCRPGGLEETRERAFWSDATCLEIAILPDAGHFVQLHGAAATAFDALALDWVERRVGTGPGHGATQACEAEAP